MTTTPVKLFKDQIEELHERATELSKQLDALDKACDDSEQGLDELEMLMARAADLREVGRVLSVEANEITSKAPTAIFEVPENVRPALGEYSRRVFSLCQTMYARADVIYKLIAALIEERRCTRLVRFSGLHNWWNNLFGRRRS